ncbi:protein-disulfide reductase DsbD domain-containing protein [Ketogulonicigenium robustum]|nr:protein-disulfide reductase DsbD domain-containing protein [Ketogulonicigenium robustum]
MTPKKLIALAAFSLLPMAASFAMAPPAHADDLADVVDMRILPGWRTDRGTQIAGVQITLAPGWKTYWRSPGEAGIPPQIALTSSQNITNAQFQWPVPQAFETAGMRTIGYVGSVTLPIEISLSDPDAPAHIAGDIEIGVCKDICIPVRLDFDAALPKDGPRDPLIAAALVDRPQTATEAGAGPVRCDIRPGRRGFSISAAIPLRARHGGPEVTVIESGIPGAHVSEAQTSRQGDVIYTQAEIFMPRDRQGSIDRSRLRFTVLSPDGAVDLHGCVGG